MYKTTVFIVVFISLSIATVGARLLWDSGSKRSGDPIDLQNHLALDSLTNSRRPVYHGPFDEGQTNVRPGVEKVWVGNELKRSHFYSTHSVYNDVEFGTYLGSKLNSNMSQSFDVDATQEYIASFMDRPSMNRSSRGSSSSRHGGGSASNRSGSGSGGGSVGKSVPGYLNDPVPEIDVADGGNPEIPDWVYPPVSTENLGDFPADSRKNPFRPINSFTPVPEPATMLLFGAGLASLVGYRLRRKKS